MEADGFESNAYAALEYLSNYFDDATNLIDSAISEYREDGLPVFVGVSFSCEGFPEYATMSGGLLTQPHDGGYNVSVSKFVHAVLMDLSVAGLDANPEGRDVAFKVVDAINEFYRQQHFPVSEPVHSPMNFHLASYEDYGGGLWYPCYNDDEQFVGYYATRPSDERNYLYGFWIF